MPKAKAKAKAKDRPAAADMSTAEAAVATLIGHGLDTIYALPGIHNDHLFDAFQRAGDTLRLVHTRHEQGAAYMALGAALATGKPQAYVVVPGPGLLNSGAALLTAYGMNAPVLALIGYFWGRWWREAARKGSLEARLKIASAFTFDFSDRLLTLREGVTERVALYNNSGEANAHA